TMSTPPPDDWDKSMSQNGSSVAFPGTGDDSSTLEEGGKDGKRTLSELLRIHAEKGTEVKFTQEEANRLGDVLGQWINAGSSPYEGEDDFFSKDDLSTLTRNGSADTGRPRGKSEAAAGKS
ncbi:hypothetical protein CYLTODRAFT_359157, partial [Cylindrobasidium torrendii FP15055 ss-10]